MEKEIEIEALKNENRMLRKELADVLVRNKIIEDEKLKFELGLLSIFPEAEKMSLSDRELQLFKDFLLLRESLRKLSVRKDALSRDLERFLNDAFEPNELPVLKAGIRVRFEELAQAFDRLALLVEGAVERPNLERCSVLDVDNENNIITLSAGTVEGAFCGLYLMAKDDNSIVVTLVAVRPFSSAALLVEGEIEKIVPGMIFVPGRGK